MTNQESIAQILWSKKEYNGQDLLIFYLPEINKVTNEISGTHFIPAGCNYKIEELIFFVNGKIKSNQLLDHMMNYAYCNIRVVDKDFLILPCMCMNRGYRTLEYKINIPIRIESYMNTCVYLHFSKKFKGKVDILCGYNGQYNRRIV